MRKKTKFFLLRTSVILVFSLLAARVWYIQVVMGSYYKHQGDTSKIRQVPVPALRGIIYDRNGTAQLVYNAPAWDIEIVPHGVPHRRSGVIYRRLSQLLHNHPSPRKIRKIVKANMWNPYAPVLIKPNVADATAMVIKQLHTSLPGVLADPASKRQYVLDGSMANAHILGYTSIIGAQTLKTNRRLYPKLHYNMTDIMGADGIEYELEPYLHGINGTEQVEVDAGERPVRVLKKGWMVPGDSIYLTIDGRLQRQVSLDLQAALQHLGVQKGVAVVENVHTGEVLAMASLPSYNNNWFSTGITPKEWKHIESQHALDNLATQGQYPPGSTYKVITAAAALQTHVVDVNTTYDDTGSIKLCSVYDPTSCRVFYGWQASGLGPMNVISALARSSDIYFYTVAGGNPNLHPDPPYVGAQRLSHYARLLGLGAKTGIELPNEATGLVPSPRWFNHLNNPILRNPGDVWHIGDTYNMAIGQGFNLATPLQMANVAATIANGGTLYRPRIVRAIVGRVIPRTGALKHSQVIQPFVPSIIRSHFLSPTTVSLIQEGMHHGVNWPNWLGTSFLTQDPRIDASGKTGTAEDLPRPPHAWWIGFAPYDNPQIAVCVLVPNAGGEGAYAAAPIAHKIFEDYFHLKPYLPDRPGDTNWLDDVSAQLVGSGGSQ